MDHASQNDHATQLDEILAEYLQALESGQAPNRQTLIERHPQFATELQEFFSDRDQFERAVQPLVAANASGASASTSSTVGGETSPPAIGNLLRYFGDYELLAELGRGGMGVVYKARQVSLQRTVALKMVLAGQFAGPGEVKRFQVEAENAAGLDHPNIVPIHEVGRHHGQHYYSMKLIEGGSLAAQISRFVGHPRTSAALIAKTARAVHYAHERGILHRDIKPSNILLDSQNAPQVTDFGLARRLGQDSNLTLSGALMGSPRYMSPEQARGEKVLSVAVDVHALGAVFYELLTGTPAFVAETAMETLRLVREQEPAPPSTLLPRLDRDLETVCLKCLEKESAKRYASALALAEDLERWLAGELITARPATLWQRTTKWAKRRPALATLTLVSVITTLLFVAISVGVPYAVRLRHALKDARQARQEEHVQRGLAEQARQAEAAQRKLTEGTLVQSENYLYLSHIALAERDVTAGNVRRAEELLDACLAQKRNWEWYHLKQLCHPELASMEVAKNKIATLSLSAHQTRIAVVCDSGSLRVLNPMTFEVLFELGDYGVTCAAFSPDGLLLAIAQQDGQLKLLEAATGKEVRACQLQAGSLTAVAFSSDSRTVASASQQNSILLFDVNSLEKPLQVLEGHSSRYDDGWAQVNCLAFSSDGRSLVSGSGKPKVTHNDGRNPPEQPGQVKLWRLQEPNIRGGIHAVPIIEPARDLGTAGTVLAAIAISPDGKYVAAGGADQMIRLWETNSGTLVTTFRDHSGAIMALVFDPERERLYSAGDTTVRGWDLTTLNATFVHHGVHPVSALAYDPATKRLFSGDAEGRVNVWNSQPHPANLKTFSLAGATDVAFSRDGGRLAAVGRGTLSVWGLADNLRLFEVKGIGYGRGSRIAFNSDGRLLAVKDRGVALYAADTGALIRRLNLPSPIHGLAFSSDGKRIAAASEGDGQRNGEWAIWDVASGAEMVRIRNATPIWDIAFSEDGRFVATGSGKINKGSNGDYGGIPGQIELWNASTGERVRTFSGSRYCVWGVALSPDGKRIASAAGLYQNNEGEAKIWDTSTGEEVFTFSYPHCAFRVAFSPDNLRLAVAGGRAGWHSPSTLMLWDLRTGKEVLGLPLAATSYGVTFDHSGTHLAAAAYDGVRVWGPGARASPHREPLLPTTQSSQ